jgi:hypothetical protein
MSGLALEACTFVGATLLRYNNKQIDFRKSHNKVDHKKIIKIRKILESRLLQKVLSDVVTHTHTYLYVP